MWWGRLDGGRLYGGMLVGPLPPPCSSTIKHRGVQQKNPRNPSQFLPGCLQPAPEGLRSPPNPKDNLVSPGSVVSLTRAQRRSPVPMRRQTTGRQPVGSSWCFWQLGWTSGACWGWFCRPPGATSPGPPGLRQVFPHV